jgi:hypothetical protein
VGLDNKVQTELWMSARTATKTVQMQNLISSVIDQYYRVHFKEHDMLFWKMMAPYMETTHKDHIDSF